jgi:hypothetical protein
MERRPSLAKICSTVAALSCSESEGSLQVPGHKNFGHGFETCVVCRDVVGQSAALEWDGECSNIEICPYLPLYVSAYSPPSNPSYLALKLQRQ